MGVGENVGQNVGERIGSSGKPLLSTSNNFPPYVAAPAITSYVSGDTFNNTYYCDPAGNDTTGDGSSGTPWFSLAGASSGGSGTAIAAGDLLYFNGGTYSLTLLHTDRKTSPYRLNIDGTASDYIVITATPGETPIIECVGDYRSMQVEASYVVVDGLEFNHNVLLIGSRWNGRAVDNVTVQNNKFTGWAHDGTDDQPTGGGHVTIVESAAHIIVRNNAWDGTTTAGSATTEAHALKNYNGSEGISDNVSILYNTFYNNGHNYGTINHKGGLTNWEIAYNRFEACANFVTWGPNYLIALVSDTYDIHHNVFDGMDGTRTGGQINRGAILCKGNTSAFYDMSNLEFYSNIIINSGLLVALHVLENNTMELGGRFGEVYNNAVYIDSDVIYEDGNTFYDNLPSYLDYNAYPSITVRDTATNRNSETNWQGNAHVQAAHGITRTGTSQDYFYTIENDNGFVGAGRYGDNIGGFTF